MRIMTAADERSRRARCAGRAVLLGLVVTLLPWGSRAGAQQSASYRVENAVINSGGRPEQGVVLAGATYRISLDAIGDPAAIANLSSASFRLDEGTAAIYGAPGEVQNIRFSSASAMTWDADKSVGSYNLYRGLTTALPGGFGTCFQSALGAATSADAASPALGQAFFYLPTAKNRIGEEGTKGYQTGNTERPNPSPCP